MLTNFTQEVKIMDWYLLALKKYAVFEGRASREEYWMFVILNLIFQIAAGYVDGALTTRFGPPQYMFGIISLLYGLMVLIPGLAVAVRRLHDVGKSGWWFLIGLIPFINFVGIWFLLYWYVKDSDPEQNQYGPNPKKQGAEPQVAKPY
jgi:uncharacterized membrane protein YhaH (DUF805 family)